jgi:hypothetical protein
MREFSKVSPQFWIGATGKNLRSLGVEAQIVSMYLLTCPHSNMIGLYYLPIMYIAHETGLGFEGASKGLRSSIEAGFCMYDDTSEMVFVMEMARYQLDTELKPSDKRCKGVQSTYDGLPENPFLSEFYDKYQSSFHLTKRRKNTSPLEAPSKPLRSKEKEKETETEKETEKISCSNASRLSDLFREFWSTYPRKVGKANAIKAFAKLKPDKPTLQAMLQAIERMQVSGALRDPQFIPHPATWLNGRRWEDDVDTEYSDSEKDVIASFNESLGDRLGSVAESPFSCSRAGAIRDFLTFSDKAGFPKLFFQYVAERCDVPPNAGFDWLTSREGFDRVKGGQFERRQHAA